MARGTQLLQLVTMLREEVGRATSVAVGVDDLPMLKQKLSRTQEMLYDDYDWPFLRQVFPYKQLNAGEQYYDFPDLLNLERLEEVALWYNNLPRPLVRGISTREYAIYNSNNGVTQEPAIRWDVRWTGTKEQFEIWPIPSSNSQQVQFTGIRKLRALIADSDVCDIDDQAIVLTAAAEILAKQENASASAVAKLAAGRIKQIKGRQHGGERTRRMGQGVHGPDERIPIIVHARST
jgi:hypothetical protein